MKTTIISIILGFVFCVVIIFSLYAFFGFLNWIFNDPFDWFPDYIPNEYKEPNDFQRCRDSGGFPIKNNWNGDLKNCVK